MINQSRRTDLGAVALTGDLIDVTARSGVERQTIWALARLRQIGLPLLACSGNHDVGEGPLLKDAAWLTGARRANVWIDESATVGGHRFRCIGWNDKIPVEADPEECWLFHAGPDQCETSISRGGAGFGSFEFGELCRAGGGPMLALSGHVHDPQNWHAKVGRTLSLNPGRPTEGTSHILINFDRRLIYRVTAGDTDVLRF
jgi:Icc-related predicted phosphoesterase